MGVKLCLSQWRNLKQSAEENFGTKREKTTGGWRKLHNEEQHYLYSSGMLKIVKSRRMSLLEHVGWKRG
jgi:hypothetical protein